MPIAALLWTMVLATRWLAAGHPDIVERVYARRLYPLVAGLATAVTGALPFSLGEVVALLAVVAFPWWTLRAIRRRRGEGRGRALLDGVAGLTAGAAALVLVFDLSWGLNYHREPVAELLAYDVSTSDPEELAALTLDLLAESLRLRHGLAEDGEGVLRLKDGRTGALRRAPRAYSGGDLGGLPVPRLCGGPKSFVLSPAMAYFGISGLFVPFTAEPTVNATLPDWEVPFTASHELAHQRGFAREDEANYVGYLACRAHPDRDFQYSGTFRASLYALTALAGADRGAYGPIRAAMAPPLQRDLRALQAWLARYESRLGDLQERVNDAYLKTQGQEEGVRSYGRMVDLLLAERRPRRGVATPRVR